jgi:hypothetical protein
MSDRADSEVLAVCSTCYPVVMMLYLTCYPFDSTVIMMLCLTARGPGWAVRRHVCRDACTGRAGQRATHACLHPPNVRAVQRAREKEGYAGVLLCRAAVFNRSQLLCRVHDALLVCAL